MREPMPCIFAILTAAGSPNSPIGARWLWFLCVSANAVSLRLGHAQALTTVQVVIHSLRAASLPPRRYGRKCALIVIRFISPYPWGIAARKRTMCLFACSPPGRGHI